MYDACVRFRFFSLCKVVLLLCCAVFVDAACSGRPLSSLLQDLEFSNQAVLRRFQVVLPARKPSPPFSLSCFIIRFQALPLFVGPFACSLYYAFVYSGRSLPEIAITRRSTNSPLVAEDFFDATGHGQSLLVVAHDACTKSKAHEMYVYLGAHG